MCRPVRRRVGSRARGSIVASGRAATSRLRVDYCGQVLRPIAQGSESTGGGRRAARRSLGHESPGAGLGVTASAPALSGADSWPPMRASNRPEKRPLFARQVHVVKFHPEGGMIAAASSPDEPWSCAAACRWGKRPRSIRVGLRRARPAGWDHPARVRERYRYLRWWAPLLAEPVELITFVMSRRMLRGIKERGASVSSLPRPLERARRRRRFGGESAHAARLVESMPRRALGQGG